MTVLKGLTQVSADVLVYLLVLTLFSAGNCLKYCKVRRARGGEVVEALPEIVIAKPP